MGGRIATMTALQHPQRFGVVGAFSAALRMDTNAAVAGAAGSPTYFYVSCGTADSLLGASQQFAMQLAAQKLAHEYHEIPGGEPRLERVGRRAARVLQRVGEAPDVAVVVEAGLQPPLRRT